jgi:carbon-monoxide dehydrogenase medium subunit
MYNFNFIRPKTIPDAVKALATEDAVVMSGGQTLIPTLKQRLASPSLIVSLNAISAMRGIFLNKEGLVCIRGATTHSNVAKNTSYPGLSNMAAHIGDPAVRNRGTIGGSLANNDPAACYPSAVLASGASIITNLRQIEAHEYFQGMFETMLGEGEIITEVKFPIPMKANYQKFVQPASRFALVGVFVAKYSDGVRVAITGASESVVFRWTDAENALNKDFSSAAVSQLSLDPDGMIGDLHGSPKYRAHLVGVMTGRAVSQSLASNT